MSKGAIGSRSQVCSVGRRENCLPQRGQMSTAIAKCYKIRPDARNARSEALRDLRAEKDAQIAELRTRLEAQAKQNAELAERLKVLEQQLRAR
ncbi:MAG: hypothetical protein KF691_13695 [Phycisphaeraceae bacterium]|nr:hypothetical protein [Phycisphaeraceae bacterium]